jgi:hypothetical protein
VLAMCRDIQQMAPSQLGRTGPQWNVKQTLISLPNIPSVSVSSAPYLLYTLHYRNANSRSAGHAAWWHIVATQHPKPVRNKTTNHDNNAVIFPQYVSAAPAFRYIHQTGHRLHSCWEASTNPRAAIPPGSQRHKKDPRNPPGE